MNAVVRAVLVAITVICGVLISQWAEAADVSVTLPPGVVVPGAAQPSPDLDVERATQAYLALLTPEQRARSDAYFEGGYWLQLWNWLAGTAAALLFLLSGWGRRIRNRVAPRAAGFWQTFVFAVLFLLITWALTLPLTMYEDYFREHAYGSSNLTFGGWLRDEIVGLLMLLAFGGLFLGGIYSLIRKAGNAWWAWATAFTFVFLVFGVMVTPVFINPAFNDYKPLPDGEARDAVLSLARASQVPAQNVMWYDASKQTKRISANVSGMFGTTQISLNDNLLEKTSLPEIRSVMAHEMGHYVLNHGLRHSIYLTLLFMVGFLVVDRVLKRVIAAWGSRLDIRAPGDPVTLPILIAVFTTYLFIATPIRNQIIMAGEVEADLYALNASREPHGFSTVAMRLGSYRKLEPGRIEKLIFYDHPSGRDRVEMSMQWLKENHDALRAMVREASIVALGSKAEDLRRIARGLGLKYTESDVPGESGHIRFTFLLTEEELSRLIGAVPHDVYAQRGYFGG
jgi:STE24 endopeptidase